MARTLASPHMHALAPSDCPLPADAGVPAHAGGAHRRCALSGRHQRTRLPARPSPAAVPQQPYGRHAVGDEPPGAAPGGGAGQPHGRRQPAGGRGAGAAVCQLKRGWHCAPVVRCACCIAFRCLSLAHVLLFYTTRPDPNPRPYLPARRPFACLQPSATAACASSARGRRPPSPPSCRAPSARA